MKCEMLVEELKKELKKCGINYRILAKNIGLSEAAVKRMFAERNFSLRRLDEICNAINIDVGDLVRAAQRNLVRQESFTVEVEEELAADPQLLLLLYYLLMKHPQGKICKDMKLEKSEFYKLARRLEKLRLIEVLPNNRTRVSICKSTRWAVGGPLTLRFGLAVKEQFFETSFNASDEYQDFLTGVLTAESFKILKRKMAELFKQFDQLSDLDCTANDSETQVYWFYSGIRPWAPIEVIKKVLERKITS